MLQGQLQVAERLGVAALLECGLGGPAGHLGKTAVAIAPALAEQRAGQGEHALGLTPLAAFQGEPARTHKRRHPELVARERGSEEHPGALRLHNHPSFDNRSLPGSL